MNPNVAAAWPFLALLIVVAVVLVVLHERAMRHDDDEIAEAVERARCGMPAGHLEKLTVLLLPSQEWDCAEWDRELDPEAAE